MTNTDAMTSLHRYPGPSLPTPNHIRLVSLQPGGDEDAVVCELTTVELESAPQYEALSYTWGDPLDFQAVYISTKGQPEAKELLVTRSCVSALRRLRLPDRPRILWIDALAIDQSDATERNHQVTLMSQIYSRAARLAIYLGESSEDCELAMAVIEDLDDPSPGTTSLSFTRSDRVIQALERFFRLPWFTRVWVIQEAVLSGDGTAYCGDEEIEWSAIKNFHEWNIGNHWLAKLPFVVSTSKQRLIKEDAMTSLFNALRKTRRCEATDPRDKIYSLLPLLDSFGEKLKIKPRYQDLVAQVYTHCAVVLLDRIGFELLHSVQGESEMENLPSWVPDWSIPPRREVIGERRKMNHKWADAPRSPLVMMASDASLRIASYSIGNIQSLGLAYHAGKGHFPIENWENLIPSDPANRERYYEAFARVLVCGESYGFYYRVRHFFEIEQDLRGKSWEGTVHRMTVERSGGDGDYVLPFEDIPFRTAGRHTAPSAAIYIQAVLRNCHSRRFMVMEGGYIGLAPAEAQIGDEVLYLHGSGAVFVMRRSEGERDGDGDGDGSDGMRRFRLVGECFMEEEAWEHVEAADALELVEVI